MTMFSHYGIADSVGNGSGTEKGTVSRRKIGAPFRFPLGSRKRPAYLENTDRFVRVEYLDISNC